MRDCWRGWLAKMYDYDLLAFTTKEVTAIKILITAGRAEKQLIKIPYSTRKARSNEIIIIVLSPLSLPSVDEHEKLVRAFRAYGFQYCMARLSTMFAVNVGR